MVESSDGAVILPLTLPEVDMASYVDGLGGSLASVSGLTYSVVSIETLATMTVTDIRNTFMVYLDDMFVQAPDISGLEASFLAVFNGIAGKV